MVSIAPDEKTITTTIGRFDYDTLILACGALHTYFGNIEAGPRILPTFSEKLSRKATRSLEHLGVEVRAANRVSRVDDTGIEIGQEKLAVSTVIWAAGIRAATLLAGLEVKTDSLGRVLVSPDLSLEGRPEIFVAGDQARLSDDKGNPLPGIAPVAQQQGEYLARTIRGRLKGKPQKPFHYADLGQLATIGRSRAILEFGWFKISGFPAWFLWVIIHIYFLIGFQNRLFVILRWASSYLSFRRGARLVVNKTWRSYPDGKEDK
ncbi:MAG: FAD-dependent oxidoreductase [Desulfosalsimonadaceae bacterium]